MTVLSNNSNGNNINKSGQINKNGIEVSNNANNIRNAANLATASKNPYVKAAGHAVRGLDKLTGGKSSEALGNGLNKANRFMPGGRKTQNAANKLAKSGLGDTLSKASSNKKDDVGENNLKNAVANKDKNRRWSIFNSKKRNNSNQTSPSKNENSLKPNDVEENGTEKIAASLAKKVVLFLLPIAAIFLVLFVAIFAIISSINSIFPFLIPNGVLKGQTINEKGTKEYDEETKYYAKLEKVASDFKKKCENEELNINIIHTILLYSYYGSDNLEGIDYKKMTDMVDIVIEDLPENCGVDYSIGGDYYLKLLNDQRIVDYYKNIVSKDKTIGDVLTEAFNLASAIDVSFDKTSQVAIPDELDVTGVSNEKNVTMKDYLSGVLYASLDNSILTDTERVKAYSIALSTNIMAENNITINTQSISVSKLNYRYCDPNNCADKSNISDIVKNNINNAINSVYGNVLVDPSGNYKTVSMEKIADSNGNDYKEILSNAYDGYTIKEIREDSYANGVNFGYEKILTPVIFYDQNDYTNAFCGRNNGTIKTSGCGVTSMAIIASTYANDKKFDPVYMMQEAYKHGYCGSGISGTAVAFFKYEAGVLGYNHLKVGKNKASDLNILTSHLKKGHLAIAHMHAGHFTTGGHYIVLGGIDPETKKVYVYDPYDRVNKSWLKSGNGWYSLNDIVAKEANAFYIIWKE